jgi:hypothetical protein
MIKEAQNAIWFLSLCILVVCKHTRNCTQENHYSYFTLIWSLNIPFCPEFTPQSYTPLKITQKDFNDQSSIGHYSAAGCQVSTPLQLYPLHPFVPPTRPKRDIPFNPILSFGCLVEVVLPFAATFCIQYHSIHKNLLAQTGNMTTLNYHNIYCARAK